jgi:hypothetical protein
VSGVQVFNPATNKIEDVDADTAQAGFVAGKYHLPNKGEVFLSADDGTTMIFPTAKAPDMIADGWRFANPKQVAAKKVDDSGLQQAQGAVEGALGELSFGGSDLALRGMGVDQDMLNARRESTAGQAGKYAGLGIGLFGETGLKLLGEGVAKAGLEHALLPTLGVTAAGDAIEQGAKKLLANTITNEAVAHTVASGLGRAAEGAAYGAGGALSEEAMGDPEINAQHILAAAGSGALLGGVAGAGLRGLSEYRAGRVAKAGEEAHLAEREALKGSVGQKGVYGIEAPLETAEEFMSRKAAQGEPLPEQGVRRWLKGYHEQIDKLSALAGSNPEDLRAIGSETGQAWLRKGKQALDDSARRMKDAINDVISEQTEASKNYYGSLKSGALDLIPKGSDAAVLRNVGDALDRVRAVRDNAVSDYARLGFDSEEQAAKAFRNMDALVNDAEDRIFKSVGAGRDVVEKRVVQHPYYDRKVAQEGMGEQAPVSISREEVTSRKRSLQELADSGHPLPEGTAKKAFQDLEEVKRRIAEPANLAGKGEISDVAQRELNSRFKDAWAQLKTHLEDTTVWGKMGDVQKSMNDAFSARQKAFDDIERIFKVDQNGHVDPGAVHAYVSKIDKMRGDAATEALDRWHQAQNAYSDAIDKHFAAGGFGAKSRAAAGRYQAARKELEEGAMTFNALEREIKRRYQNFGGSGLGGGILGAGLGVVAGPLGVAGGFAANQLLQHVLDPGRRALNRAAFTNVLDKVEPHIQGKVEALMNGTQAAGKAAVGPFGQRVVTRATIKMLEAKTPEERRKAYDERVAELQHLSDPKQFSDNANQQLLGMNDTMPAHAAAMTQQAANALQYIRAAQPPSTPGTMGGGGPFDALYATGRPADRDIKKFAEIDKAAQDPLSVIEGAMKKGAYVFKHQIDTLQALYPQLLQTVRQAIITQAGQSDKPPSAAVSRVLTQLLGGTPVGAQQLKRFQAVHQQQAPKPPPPTPPSSAKTARSVQMQTTSDRMESYPL